MINRFLRDRLLISKIGFSVFNLLIILLLNLFFEAKLAGTLLYTQSIVFLIATFSRFGSDFYWVSSSDSNVKVSTHEVILLIFTSLLSTLVIVMMKDSSFQDNFLWIFVSVINVNIIYFLARCYQKAGEHIKSLFLFTVGPMIFTVPILYYFNNLNIHIIIFVSTILILLSLVLFARPNVKVDYVKGINLAERLNFFPMIFYGFLSQNIIALYSGYISKEEHTSLLVLFRKICGLTLWPQIFHMQQHLKEIRESTKSRKEFINYFIDYLKTIKGQILFYSILSMLIAFITTQYMGKLDGYTFIAFITILLATLINLVLGYMKYQIGVTKNGFFFFIGVLFSIFLVSLMKFTPYIEYISIALSFLLYSFFNHVFGFILLSKKLKNA